MGIAVACFVSALYAAALAVFSGEPAHRIWGMCAAGGYGAAGLAALLALAAARSRPPGSGWPGRGRDAAVVLSLAGALAAPLAWLAATGLAQPETGVVARSAALLLRHGTPYLSSVQLAHLANAPYSYDPYLPVMSLSGLPRAAGAGRVAGDPRLWLVLGSLVLLGLAFRISSRHGWARRTAIAATSPVLALPLAVGGTDVPVLALMCLGLACAVRAFRQRWAVVAAVVFGIACAMKYTAWPAIPVVSAMLAARDGARAAARFAAVAVLTAVAATAATAPALFAEPAAIARTGGAVVRNTVLFPLGLTPARSPATSPLPGHLLAATGPAGHAAAIGLLAAALLVIVVSLIIRPPAGAGPATRRLAVGLALLFTLAPSTRWGYFLYPLGLIGWLALARARRPETVVTSEPEPSTVETCDTRPAAKHQDSPAPAR